MAVSGALWLGSHKFMGPLRARARNRQARATEITANATLSPRPQLSLTFQSEEPFEQELRGTEQSLEVTAVGKGVESIG